MRIIHFLGYSGSGKTTAIEFLTRALTKKGKKVGTIKHVHDATFTFDKPGKDTWRHAKAGASQVVMIAPHELAILREQDTSALTLDDILADFEKRDFDFVMVEGLHGSFSGRPNVVRVLSSRSRREATDLMRKHRESVAFVTGKIAQKGRGAKAPNTPYLGSVPVVRLPEDMDVALSLIAGRPRGARNQKRSNRGVR